VRGDQLEQTGRCKLVPEVVLEGVADGGSPLWQGSGPVASAGNSQMAQGGTLGGPGQEAK